jgi:hypothetical protein
MHLYDVYLKKVTLFKVIHKKNGMQTKQTNFNTTLERKFYKNKNPLTKQMSSLHISDICPTLELRSYSSDES